MNFTNIPSELVIDIIKRIDLSGFIDIASNQNISYNIIITGSVGVGKSTVSQILYEILKDVFDNIQIYPEYIKHEFNNVPLGNLMLDARINNVISAETFQHFVLDIWDNQLKQKQFKKGNSINILERLPEDAVSCFTKEAYDDGEISELAWNNINQKLININEKYNVPKNSDCEFKLVDNNNELSTTIQTIINTIIDDVKNGIKNRVFGLIINKDEYRKRIVRRGRQSEINNDTSIYDRYNDYYSNLYDCLSLK